VVLGHKKKVFYYSNSRGGYYKNDSRKVKNIVNLFSRGLRK
jgi:hypothetical protein